MPSHPTARIGSGYGIAENVVLVDYDGTIIQWSNIDDEDPKLMPGVVEAMKLLASKGKRIYIFTSRLSQRWLDSEGRTAYDQYHHVRDVLDKHDIPFVDIIGEKVPAEAYIDDMAVGFRGDWAAALAELNLPEHARRKMERTPNGRTWCSCGWVGLHRDFTEHAA